MKRYFTIIGVLTLLIGSIWTVAYFQKSKIAMDLLGSDAKSFPTVTFKSVGNGQDVVLSPGKEGTLVHFWATWCPPCIAEMPELLEYLKSLGPKQRAYIIAGSDSISRVKKFLAKYDAVDLFNVQFLIDESGSSMKEMGTLKLPESYIYKGSGELSTKISGANNWKVFAPNLNL
jgi:thiol-disulfide isomerase/thioredoxin